MKYIQIKYQVPWKISPGMRARRQEGLPGLWAALTSLCQGRGHFVLGGVDVTGRPAALSPQGTQSLDQHLRDTGQPGSGRDRDREGQRQGTGRDSDGQGQRRPGRARDSPRGSGIAPGGQGCPGDQARPGVGVPQSSGVPPAGGQASGSSDGHRN